MHPRVEHFILPLLLALVSCGTQESREEQPNREPEQCAPCDTTMAVEVDYMEAPVIEQTYIEEVPQSPANHTAVVETYDSGSRSKEDDWEELRQHSPNDNYLLGFDEDVDDVHDMELYMEDY